MSKYTLRKHTFGFTIVSNAVIQELKTDLECLGFYTYILSLPDNWTFYKTQLAKGCKIGIKKLDRILKKLGSFDLVKCGQKRNEQGQFSDFYMDIYDLDTLKINKLDEELQIDPPEGQNCRTAETVGRSGEAIQETYTKEINTNKQDKDIGQPSVDPKSSDPSLFDDFWKEYPRRVKRKKTKIIWDQKKLYLIFDQIISNIRQRNATEWKGKEKQYIPHPTTYLNNEQWNDEILEINHDRKENSVERSFREGLERIKQLQQCSEWEASIVSTQDSSSVDRAALPPF